MPSNVEIRIFQNLDELSRAAADRFCQVAGESVADGGPFCAALSGGSTPRELYHLVAGPEFTGRIPWAFTHLFQVDERSVPPDHVDSNYRMMREALVEHAPLPLGHFHRLAGEAQNLEEAARSYSKEIAEVLRPGPGEWPVFDLILLGMGPDGHTASLFPGSAALAEDKLWVVPNEVEKLKTWRLTLTFPVINSAREVIFLVAGADKAETLRRVLRPASAADRFPAQRIQPLNGHLRWYLDQAAARLL